MRKGLLLVVVLLAVSSLLAAAAYNAANITNAAELSVVSTDDALLALEAKDSSAVGMEDATARYENGNLVFKFGQGRGDVMFGLQQNSTYEWFNNVPGSYYGLFKVWNNSKDHVKVTLKAENVPDGVDIYVLRCYNGGISSEWTLISDDNGATFSNWNPGANNWFGVRIVTGDLEILPVEPADMQIVVSAEAYAN